MVSPSTRRHTAKSPAKQMARAKLRQSTLETRLSRQSRAEIKRKKSKEVIEISSSLCVPMDLASESPKYAETSPKDAVKEDFTSKPTTPDENPSEKDGKKVGPDELTRLGSTVDHLTKIVSSLTSVFFNQNPDLSNAVPFVLNSTEVLSKLASAEDNPLFGLKLKRTPETEVNEVLKKVTRGKKLFVSPSKQGQNIGLYMNLEALHHAKSDGKNSGVSVPSWVPMLFKPPINMMLDDVESTIAAYVFGANKDNEKGGLEILAKTKTSIFGDRKGLKSLMPKSPVDQDVLNLQVSWLTYQQRMFTTHFLSWFLPTYFAQYVTQWNTTPEKLMEWYQQDFMGKIHKLLKIFIPINDNNDHWFLLVVDMANEKLTMLDSSPCAARMKKRKRQVKKIALFLEEMFDHDSFYENNQDIERPEISEFAIVQPHDIGKQLVGSNDCGIFVAKWMSDCIWDSSYKIKVDKETRMRLAIDLILKPYNTMRNDIIRLAATNWKKLEEKKNRLFKANS